MNSQELDKDRSGKRLNLPEPDPENITVLTRNLPNKPILPWNHYDSPWSEAHEENIENSEIPDATAENNQPELIAAENTDNQSEEYSNSDDGIELQSDIENLEELDKDQQKDELVSIPPNSILSTLRLSDKASTDELPNEDPGLYIEHLEASDEIELLSESGQEEFVVGSEPLATNQPDVSSTIKLDPEFFEPEDEDEDNPSVEIKRLSSSESEEESLADELPIPSHEQLEIIDEDLKIVDDELKQLG